MQEIEAAEGQALAVPGDVTREEDLRAVAEAAVERLEVMLPQGEGVIGQISSIAAKRGCPTPQSLLGRQGCDRRLYLRVARRTVRIWRAPLDPVPPTVDSRSKENGAPAPGTSRLARNVRLRSAAVCVADPERMDARIPTR